MIRALHRVRRLDVLLPHESLSECSKQFAVYWSRFRAQYPEHELWNKLSPYELQMTLPIKLHGDEGRSHSARKSFAPKKVIK